jgi:hypothetical protein
MQTYPVGVSGQDQKSPYKIKLNTIEYIDSQGGLIDYFEYILDANDYIPEGEQRLKVGFKLTYPSKNSKVLQNIKNKEITKEIKFNFNTHQPTNY